MKTLPWHNRLLEKVLLVSLFVVTIGEFATRGSQSMKYLLSTLFDVSTITTPADLVIGVMAMIASALVFAGCALQWKPRPSTWKYFRPGVLLFSVKSVLDLANQVWLFKLAHPVVTSTDIETLAGRLGTELLQLAFWVFIFYYFRHVIHGKK